MQPGLHHGLVRRRFDSSLVGQQLARVAGRDVLPLATGPRGGLVIDDIGAGYVDKGWTKTRFERLFDIRYERRLPTAIATNLSGEGFLAAVGERVYSRVSDSSLGRILNLQHCEDVRSLLGSDT